MGKNLSSPSPVTVPSLLVNFLPDTAFHSHEFQPQQTRQLLVGNTSTSCRIKNEHLRRRAISFKDLGVFELTQENSYSFLRRNNVSDKLISELFNDIARAIYNLIPYSQSSFKRETGIEPVTSSFGRRL
jgi:hypothetical protein